MNFTLVTVVKLHLRLFPDLQTSVPALSMVLTNRSFQVLVDTVFKIRPEYGR